MDKVNEKTQQKQHVKLQTDMTPILLAALLGFVLIALFVILRRRASSRRRDFLLTGLSEAGKSAIYMQLLHGKVPQTFTSITENVGDYKAGGARLVDIPGHYRVRDKYFDQYKRTAKGLLFVVDSVTAQKEIRDVADALCAVLSDAATLPCQVLVLCNKQDQTTAKSAQVIKSLLEREMNIVRDTRSRKLQSVGEDDNNAAAKPLYLGKEGKDFEFSELRQQVQFLECSAITELSGVAEWLDKLL